jgi:hypothetical protein
MSEHGAYTKKTTVTFPSQTIFLLRFIMLRKGKKQLSFIFSLQPTVLFHVIFLHHIPFEGLHLPVHTKTNTVASVRKRTTPTERPPLVGEVNANFCG